MKKGFKFLVAASSLLFVVGCNNNQAPSTPEVEVYHLIRFVSNGGTQYQDTSIKEGDILRLPTPTRTDYEFLGWYDNAAFTGEKLEGNITPRADMTLYAKWQIVVYTYTVHFEYEGIADMTVKSNDNVITLPTVEKYGFHFNGWKLSDTGETYTGNYTVNSNLTFYPSFNEVSYVYLYLNESTDVNRIEFEPYSVVLTSSLPIPEPFVDDGYPCPFLKWVYQDGSEVDSELLLGDEPIILVAVYDHTGAPKKNNFVDIGDGNYRTTGKGINVFHDAESIQGIWSMDVSYYKNNSGGCGLAFRMTDSGKDYSFEDEGTSYISVATGASGGVQVGKVVNGTWNTLATIPFENMPLEFQEKYNSLNYVTATLTVFSEETSFSVFIDRELIYTYNNAEVLATPELQGTGFGYRASASNYVIGNMTFETGKVIHLDPNGGNPFEGETHYWDKAKTVALPSATTSVPNRVFDAWYYDRDCTQLVDLHNPQFSDDTILYASYRTPISSNVRDNGDGTKTITAKTVTLENEVSYQYYSVESTLTFEKGQSGSYGLIIRGNITADNSYEAGNSYISINMLPSSGGIQISKTGNGSNFSHQTFNSVLTGASVKSPLALTAEVFGNAYFDKYNDALDGDTLSFNLKVEDLENSVNIYIDGVKLFTIPDTTSTYEGLNGKGVGLKTSAANVTFTNLVVTEMSDPNIYIHLDAGEEGSVASDTVAWSGEGPISLPTPTVSRANRVFDCWCYDSALIEPVDPNNFVGDSTTVLHARYRLPVDTKHTDNGDGTTTINAKTALLATEVSYAKYSVETTISFKKGASGSFGLLIRTNITADNSYEAGNSYIAIQLIPSNGNFQFSKTGNGANFAHLNVFSVIANATKKSQVPANTTYFPQDYVDKFANAATDDDISVAIKVEDLGSSLNIYFDGVLLFTVSDTTDLYTGLNGKGIGYKTSATNVIYSTPVITEIA